jgi:hypothetical protein
MCPYPVVQNWQVVNNNLHFKPRLPSIQHGNLFTNLALLSMSFTSCIMTPQFAEISTTIEIPLLLRRDINPAPTFDRLSKIPIPINICQPNQPRHPGANHI